MEVPGHHGGQGDAAGLGGEDHGHLVHVKVAAKLLGDVLHQLCVNAVVQKAVHFDNVAGQYLALLGNAVLQFLHKRLLLAFSVKLCTDIIRDSVNFCK